MKHVSAKEDEVRQLSSEKHPPMHVMRLVIIGRGSPDFRDGEFLG